ncbi:MAG: glycosyltransferase [Gammaproteobacteria bacterium]|nr:glycosyltransferase [Gammaproteobacteria bacterium]
MLKQTEVVVAQIVQHLRPGGIEMMVLDLLKHQNFKTVVISLEGTKEQAIGRWPILRKVSNHLIFMNKQPGIQLSLVFQLYRLFKQHQINTIHSHHIGPLLYGGIAAKLAKISKRIHTEHDAWHLDSLKRRYLQKSLLCIVKPILVADALAVANQVKRYLNIDNIELIHNGIDIEKFTPGDRNLARAKLNLSSGVVLIGNAARLEPVKGQDLLISAMSHFSSSIHLAIAGAGSCEKALKQQVAQLNIEHRVHFLGPLDDMATFYQALDIFCLPSRAEGLPLSPLEAQACSIPALLTDVGGASEALCHATGLLINGEDITQIVTAIETLLSRSSTQNPRHFVEKFRNVKNMSNAYSKLICANN